MLDAMVGFSNGCAEFTPKNPPPLVPSCLMAICAAAGPRAMTCSWPSIPVATTAPCNVCGTPCHVRNSASTTDRGKRIHRTDLVRSTQKLPSVAPLGATKPRITATATAMPVPALTKFCTVSPAIWPR